MITNSLISRIIVDDGEILFDGTPAEFNKRYFSPDLISLREWAKKEKYRVKLTLERFIDYR